MEFALDEFVTRPSLEKLKSAKKTKLLIIARVLNVRVPYNTNKAELKRLLCTQLFEQGVLPQQATEATVSDAAGDVEVVSTLADGVESKPVTVPLVGAPQKKKRWRLGINSWRCKPCICTSGRLS